HPVRQPPRSTPFVIERPRPYPEIDARSPQMTPVQMAALLQHKDTLLREVHHRVGNSLQIVASILALDARRVHSEEARLCLANAQRIGAGSVRSWLRRPSAIPRGPRSMSTPTSARSPPRSRRTSASSSPNWSSTPLNTPS